jgi:CHAT domain-containing protein
MAAAKKSYASPSRKDDGVFIPFRAIKIAFLVVVILGLAGVADSFILRPPLQRGNAALIKAFSNRRLIEPRLAGGFKAGNFIPSKDDDAGINKGELDQANSLILDAAAVTNDPHADLSYGRLLLSTGNSRVEALKHLRIAAERMPNSAEPYNDLGVCLMERGRHEDAIDKFNLALKQNADMPEALFNRALCYERLLLRDAASQDYARLTTIERDKNWLNEIKRHHQEVSSTVTPVDRDDKTVAMFDAALDDEDVDKAKGIAAQNLEPLLKHSSKELATAYLKATIAGDNKGADRALFELQLIGSLLIERNGDTSIAGLAEYLHNLAGGERQAEIKLIAEYLELEADKLIAQKAAENRVIFQRLSDQFAERGNHLFQYYSSVQYANCDYYSSLYGSCIKKLKQSLAFVEKRPWPYRRALLFNQFSILYSRQGLDSLAFKYADRVLKAHLGMSIAEAKALQYKANACLNVGDFASGLACLRQSTALFLSSVPTYDDLVSNYLSTAELYSLIGNHELTLLYARQALLFSENRHFDKRLAQARSITALELCRLGEFDQAEEEMEHAFAHLGEVNAKQRDYTESLLWMRSGQMASLRNDNERAIESFSKAETIVDRSEEKDIPMMKVLHARAEVYVQTGEYAKAQADLEHAAAFIEVYLKNNPERKNKSDFLDATLDVFDQTALLNIKASGNWTAAFNISEQSRARALLYDLSPDQGAGMSEVNARLKRKANDNAPDKQSVKPLTLPQVQAALPDDLRLMTYSVTKQKTFIFLVTHSGFDYAESPATTEALDQMVQDYMSGVKVLAPVEELSEKARALYDLLIKPVEARLSDGKRLCIVPDKALHFLPFDALKDSSDKYLIESKRLSYAPSASVLVRCIEEAQKKGTSDSERMMAVGNPLFNTDEFPSLSPLRDAEREATESAAFYEPGSPVLMRENATKARVLAALRDCDVAHLSLHCLVEEKSPWHAALVLARQGGSSAAQDSEADGLIYLNEVYGMSLPRTKLVVLSACQSGLGQYYRGEGMVSLVRPFLALKVPTVVASLWSVDSEATAALMIDFHRQRKTNNPGTADALRAAQIKMAKSESYEHPYYWASFIVVGSNK